MSSQVSSFKFQELLTEPAGVPSREGFFWCGHCKHVVNVTQREVELAENAPLGSLVKLRCVLCRHHEVVWKFPQAPRVKPAPQPVPVERAHELFAVLKGVCA